MPVRQRRRYPVAGPRRLPSESRSKSDRGVQGMVAYQAVEPGSPASWPTLANNRHSGK